jgi:putative endonuclease
MNGVYRVIRTAQAGSVGMRLSPTIVMPAKAGISLLSRHHCVMSGRGGWTYIMTNQAFGVLHIGVTAHSQSRVLQHRSGEGSAFCPRYNLTRLVLVERHATIEEAIAREKALKAWRRVWKIRLIEVANPQWQDLWDDLQK